jgi:transposase-like protein
MTVEIKENKNATHKTIYTVQGIDKKGRKAVLGMWARPAEGGNFERMIFDELKARGVKQMPSVCIDDSDELEQAILAVYPQARVRRCVAP